MYIELNRLTQEYNGVKGTETIKFMALDEKINTSQDWTVTYARIVVDYCLQKKDPNRVRIMVGGNLIEYPYKLT